MKIQSILEMPGGFYEENRNIYFSEYATGHLIMISILLHTSCHHNQRLSIFTKFPALSKYN